MKLKIAVLAGDGIGPEIMEQGVAVVNAVAQKFGHEVEYREAICGAHAIDLVGDPFPDETFQTCMRADAQKFVRSRVCWPCARNWVCTPTYAP